MSATVEKALDAPRVDPGPTEPGRWDFLRCEAAVLSGLLVALGLFYFGPGMASIVLGGAAFFALTVYRPDLSLVMVPLTAPLFYRPRTFPIERLFYLSLPEVVILLGVSAWVLRDGWSLLRARKLPDWRVVVSQPFLGFAAALLVIGTLWLLVPVGGEARKVALREFRWTVLEPVLFFALTLRWLRTERDAWRMVGAWLVAAAFVGREGTQQYFYGQTWSMEGVGRVTSLYPSATGFGIYAGRALALSLALAFFLPRAEWRWKLATALLSVPIGLGVLFSFTRGAWIGVFVGLLAAALLARSRPVLLALGGAVLAGIAALPFVRAERITSMFNFETQDNTGVSRIKIWQAALRVLSDHPFTGIGQDQFLRVDPKYGVPHVRFLTVSHPHDWILDFWLRLGIPGVAWLAATLGYFFYRLSALWRTWKGTALGALALALLASMVDFAVHGLMDMAYFTMDLALTFWLTLALAAIMERLSPAQS